MSGSSNAELCATPLMPDLVVVGILEDRVLDPVDRDRLQVHLVVHVLERLDHVEVDPRGVLDRGDDDLLDHVLHRAEQQRDRSEEESHRREHELVEELAELADRRAEVAQEAGQAEHRHHAVGEEGVVEVAVAVGVVELCEHQVEQPDRLFVLAAVGVDAVVLRQLVLPVAVRLGIEEHVRGREAEPPPLGGARVDVRRPAGEIRADELVGRERGRVRPGVAVRQQRDHLGEELLERLGGRAAEREERVVDVALDDEEEVEDRAAVAA
jgi:ribosomal protein L9